MEILLKKIIQCQASTPTKSTEIEPAIVSIPTPLSAKQYTKILVLGDFATGKTSFIKRHVHKLFSENYRATIGIAFDLQIYNKVTSLQFWDVAGRENNAHIFYKRATGAFILFDITRPKTFESVARWKMELDSCVKLENGSPIPCILLANKCDKIEQKLPAKKSLEMDVYCRENGFVSWLETSAKDNINVDVAVNTLIAQIFKRGDNGLHAKVVSKRRQKPEDCFCNIL